VGQVQEGAGLNASDLPDDATVRFALAWLVLYFMLIAGGLAMQHDGLPRESERFSHAVNAPAR
jgi:hypothetical protein